ncbi:helix-turn-helix transcriptional regulator [Paenibacillus tritici]|uniref:helix-turn-helix domain-containing protein n=1 Tax=Paenibacillus tritici TaxID=1873425 RepID=UPI001BAD6319|nr:helix-turn-helix transcriptional regulator [Paenibacillus tritici]QUL56447.1 helix-turn-helix transcriptional regulator [Paenibacillus tritici]
MQHKSTIQAELAAFLKKESYTINQFAGLSGVNSGTLSSIINGNRPIAMQQLDRITAGMGLPEGTFYELYIDECVVHSTPDWRRLGPFLHRCAELHKLDCIRQVVLIIMDNITYAPLLFDTAEEFYGQGKLEAAALLYEGVADSEKYQHSERLALCQYRLFKIRIGQSPEADFREATRFECFVERLEELDQLGAIQQLADIYISLRHWDKAGILARELHHKTSIQYELRYYKTRKHKEIKEAQRPLCFYILYSYWLQSKVCEESGEYKQALDYVGMYSDMDWIVEESEEVRQIKEQFTKLGIVYACLYRLMCGELEVIPEYGKYIGTPELGLLDGLLKAVQAANRFHWDTDSLISRFQPLLAQEGMVLGQAASRADIPDNYPVLLYELAVYYLHTERAEQGLAYLFESLEASAALCSVAYVIRSVRLFEQFRPLASAEDQERYKQLINKVQQAHAGAKRTTGSLRE